MFIGAECLATPKTGADDLVAPQMAAYNPAAPEIGADDLAAPGMGASTPEMCAEAATAPVI